jgi:HIV-1 Vpr-binding protein
LLGLQRGGGSSGAAELPEPERRVTLTSLVSDYLSSKHALCRNPMTTCPEFDLFLPHRLLKLAK